MNLKFVTVGSCLQPHKNSTGNSLPMMVIFTWQSQRPRLARDWFQRSQKIVEDKLVLRILVIFPQPALKQKGWSLMDISDRPKKTQTFLWSFKESNIGSTWTSANERNTILTRTIAKVTKGTAGWITWHRQYRSARARKVTLVNGCFFAREQCNKRRQPGYQIYNSFIQQ